MPELLKTLRQVGMEWREDKGWRIGAVTGRLIKRKYTSLDSSSQCIGFCSTKFLKIAFHFEGRGKKFTNIINNTILVKIIITSIIKIITRKILIYINVSILSSVYCYGRLLDCHPSTVLKGGGVPTVIRLHF